MEMSDALRDHLRLSGQIDEVDVEGGNLRELSDGTYLLVKRLLFHWTLIRGDPLDPVSYLDRWCYTDREGARAALRGFPEAPAEGYEPSGWHRHPATGRRRPEGRPDLETHDR